MNMKIAIPNDPSYTGKCGVTDYTRALISGLREYGCLVEEMKISEISKIFPFMKRDAILHLQYPSLDSRYSLLPHLFSRASNNFVITLHETQTLNKIRRLSFPLFKPAACIVTNDYDFFWAEKIFPLVNVSKIPLAPPFELKNFKFPDKYGPLKIVYFGLIRNDKGLGHVVDLSNLLSRLRPDVELHIVCGNPRLDQMENFLSFKSQLSPSTKLHVGASNDALPQLLAKFDMAYLPFPNGADENRSSLLSLISLGVVPITYASERTPERFKKLLPICKSPLEAINLIPKSRELLSSSINNALMLASNYTWDLIVRRHVVMYENLLRN